MYAYFDNSATTAPCPEAVEAMCRALTECWGNPSSLHGIGNAAQALLEDSRAAVAGALGCDPTELLFTSGGTEGNNLAVLGAAHQLRRMGRRIVSTEIEHASVEEALQQLEAEGFEVVRLHPDRSGHISERALYAAVDAHTILVTMMLVNNEIGAVLPVAAARRAVLAARAPALIHCDAVQAFGKLPLRPSKLGVDLMTISSHKIHGPKGVGALYIRKGARIKPRAFGGEQERKLRPGTEPMPAIAGFAAAAAALPEPQSALAHMTALRDYFCNRLTTIDGAVINSPADGLPYIVNFSLPGVKSEPMLNYLSANGICVSAGSACSKGKKSRVLNRLELPQAVADSAVRVSFSRNTTLQEIDLLLQGIANAKAAIRTK